MTIVVKHSELLVKKGKHVNEYYLSSFRYILSQVEQISLICVIFHFSHFRMTSRRRKDTVWEGEV